jgi:hypothetical protein
MSEFTEPLRLLPINQKTALGQQVYQLIEGFTYFVGSLETPVFSVRVPAGTKTDLATMPWPVSLVYPPDGPYKQAAVLHDYLWSVARTKADYLMADAIFFDAVICTGIDERTAWRFYKWVRRYARLRDTINSLRSFFDRH